jgi:hypothetical protein
VMMDVALRCQCTNHRFTVPSSKLCTQIYEVFISYSYVLLQWMYKQCLPPFLIVSKNAMSYCVIMYSPSFHGIHPPKSHPKAIKK